MPSVTYTNVSISGYNTSPPDDDGSQVASNEIKWSNHKTKLGDPLKTAIEAIDTNVDTAITALNNCLGVTVDSPAFSANMGGVDQTGIPSSTWTQLLFPTEDFDNANDYDASTSIWTPSEEGKYAIGGFYVIDPNSFSGNKYFRMGIYKNGSLHRELQFWGSNNSGKLVSESGMTLVAANGTTDTFALYIKHETGAEEQVRGDSTRSGFWGYRVI